MATEAELRAQHARSALKIEALDWLEQQTVNVPRGHLPSCNYEDPESYGPCNCGFKEKNALKDFIKQAILEA